MKRFLTVTDLFKKSAVLNDNCGSSATISTYRVSQQCLLDYLCNEDLVIVFQYVNSAFERVRVRVHLSEPVTYETAKPSSIIR